MIDKRLYATCQGRFYPADYESNWMSDDNLKNFKKNKEQNPDLMRQWTVEKVKYNLNCYGYRTEHDLDDFPKDQNNWMILGCSHSFGVGVPFENTYGNLLGVKFQTDVVNLAVPGGSLDSCYRVCKSWFDTVRPSLVIVQAPYKFRREFLKDSEIISVGPWDEDFVKYATQFQDDVNDDFYQSKILDAIKCVIGDTNLIVFDFMNIGVQHADCARDLSHYGPDYHRFVSIWLSRIIKTQGRCKNTALETKLIKPLDG